jgi:hypothetical protein
VAEAVAAAMLHRLLSLTVLLAAAEQVGMRHFS